MLNKTMHRKSIPVVPLQGLVWLGQVFLLLMLLVLISAAGCAHVREANEDGLVGAWRGKVQFSTGPFAAITDLEFLYVFNEGGTMTESSNYDGVPPVAPAYGIWRKVGERKYEAKYIY